MVSQKCIECGLCRKECKFLEKYGNPGSIAATFDTANKNHQGMVFECSLCGLCTAVCPVDIDPAGMFLEMRRAVVQQGGGNYPEHSVILGYEKRGTSRRYT
jgi:L-lactate utilization protein LutB